MSRRRTGARYVPITISLKPSMIDDIEAELSPKQSRSQWIASAIDDKLRGDGAISVGDASALQLVVSLYNRGLFSKSMFDTLKFQIEAKKLD